MTTLLWCTDGLRSYPTQAVRVFRERVCTSKHGRSRLIVPNGLLVAQVVKRYAKRHVTVVAQRIVRGCRGAVAGGLLAT